MSGHVLGCNACLLRGRASAVLTSTARVDEQ